MSRVAAPGQAFLQMLRVILPLPDFTNPLQAGART